MYPLPWVCLYSERSGRFLLFIFAETNDVRTKINPRCGLTDEERLMGILNKNAIWPWNGKKKTRRERDEKLKLHILTAKHHTAVYLSLLYFQVSFICSYFSHLVDLFFSAVLSSFISLSFIFIHWHRPFYLVLHLQQCCSLLPLSLSLMLFAVEWIVDTFSHDEYEANPMSPLCACMCAWVL